MTKIDWRRSSRIWCTLRYLFLLPLLFSQYPPLCPTLHLILTLTFPSTILFASSEIFGQTVMGSLRDPVSTNSYMFPWLNQSCDISDGVIHLLQIGVLLIIAKKVSCLTIHNFAVFLAPASYWQLIFPLTNVNLVRMKVSYIFADLIKNFCLISGVPKKLPFCTFSIIKTTWDKNFSTVESTNKEQVL